LSKLAFTCLSLVAAFALATGCGDGDDGDGKVGASSADAPSTQSGDTAPAAQTAFDRQAEEICEVGRERVLRNLTTYQKQNGTLDSQDIGFGAVRATFLPVLREEVDDIARLEVPEGDEGQVAALLAERRRALDEIERRKLSSNLELAKALKSSDRLMVAYGLDSCTFS
jgi:hypothetical protein